MRHELCICALIPSPPVATRVRVVLMIHPEEDEKPTNTGRLAARCLARASIVSSATPFVAVDGERTALLFPNNEATPLTHENAQAIDTLVVPDGTWRQARKMRTRTAGVDALPTVTLPQIYDTTYRLRGERREGGLATLEAIAHALTVIEGNNRAARAMLDVFRVMVDRTLWLRGRLTDDDVTGGIPPEARRARG